MEKVATGSMKLRRVNNFINNYFVSPAVLCLPEASMKQCLCAESSAHELPVVSWEGEYPFHLSTRLLVRHGVHHTAPLSSIFTGTVQGANVVSQTKADEDLREVYAACSTTESAKSASITGGGRE